MDRPDYRTKAIAFQGGIVTIVCQNDNTSSPLLALCNPLLLIGKFSLNTKPGATISEGKLIKLVCNYIKTTAKVEKSKKQVMGTLRRLAEPISCDMTLTSVEHMETSEELQLFKQLGVKVFHGNVVDPKEEELVRAIGKNTYHTLLAGLLSHKAKEDVLLDSSGSSRAISHLEAVNWDLLDGFFTKNSTQLTAYGLQSLKQHLIDTDTTLCVLYWNQHFHVVLQLHGTLLLLQNSLDQFETTVVWRYFDDVNGHGFFMDSKFLPTQTAVSEMDPDGSCTQQKAGSVYVAKSVYFRGRQTFIIYPYMSGSCALVALCNAILLRGDVDLSKMFNCELSLSLPHLHQVVFKAKKTKFYTLSPEEWIVAVGCLHQPVHVNMNFKSIYNIKIAKELEIFKNFGFDLCHGFIADPEDLDLCNAIGLEYYDFTTESPTSHLESEAHRKLVDKFLKDHETALTPYGLQSLQEKLSESNLHVIFWNKQFHTAIKRKNRIYVLDPNLSSFDAREIWRCLETVDGPGATLATIRGEHKCNSPDCQLAFTSSFNLKWHNYVHPTSSGSKELDILKHRAEFGNCWDSLSSEESAEVLSLKNVKFKNIEGGLLERILQQRPSEVDKVAMTLSDIVNRSKEGEKISSAVLFGVLDAASEQTLLSSDIRSCDDDIIWDGRPVDILAEMKPLLACYSYLVEKALVGKWLQLKAALAFQIGEDLIAEEKSTEKQKLHISAHTGDRSSDSTGEPDGPSLDGIGELSTEKKKGSNQNLQGEIQNSAHTGDHSTDSTGQRDGVSLVGTGEVASDSREGRRSVEHTEDDDNIGNLHDLVLEFLNSFRKHSPKKFYRGSVEALKYMDSLELHIHFPHIKEHCAELATYIIDYYDSDRVKSDISCAAAQFLIEHNLGKPEKAIREGISVIIVDLPSPTSNMSFKKYARLNKLIRPFKLPKKFHQIFSFRWKGRLYVMTYAGRRAARGLMKYIIEMHRRKLCWRGEWKLSDLRIKDGMFLIDTEALYTADVEGMASDFKMYFEHLNPYFVIVEESFSNSPPYWEILQTDTMVIPDPLKSPEAYDGFHIICDGLRPRSEKQYQPLNGQPKGFSVGWTFKYTRHFSSHILSLTKNIAGQDVQDMILIHLMLACRLDEYLASLVRHIVDVTKMQGLFFRAWQVLLASDDKTEEEDLLENLEVSESDDEEIDIPVEDTSSMHKEGEDELQDLEDFKSKDEE